MLGRRRAVRRTAVVVLVVATLAVGAHSFGQEAAGLAVGGDTVLTAADGSGGDDDGQHAFTVSGSVTGLFPGVHTGLVLTVKNNEKFGIMVNRISVRIGNAGPECGATNLSVAGFQGSRRVPPHGTTTVTLPVTMSHAAGDGCQGARFPLRYTATATRDTEEDDASASVGAAACTAGRAGACA